MSSKIIVDKIESSSGGNVLVVGSSYEVDTIADLRLMTDTPSTVYVTGYHTKGDGAFGSNIFAWDSTSVEDDNGGTIIKLDGVTTGRYKLQYDGAISVKWFGAKGDGVTDDTAAIQAAILDADTLFFPIGTYIISDTLGSATVDGEDLNNKYIFGENKDYSIIKMVTASDIDLMILGWYNTLENLTLWQVSTATGGSNGTLRLQSLVHPEIPTDVGGNDWTDPSVGGLSYKNTLRNCVIKGGQNYNIYGINLAYTIFDTCRVVLSRGTSANLLVWGKGGTNMPSSTSTSILQGEYTASYAGAGIKFENTSTSTLDKVIIEGNYGRGILLDNCSKIKLINGYVENNFALGASTGDGDIVTVDSDLIEIHGMFILGNNSTYAVSSSNTTDSALIGTTTVALGGGPKLLNISGWQWSETPSTIHDTGNTATSAGGDTYTKFADGSFICSLRRDLTVDITTASGSLFTSSGQIITNWPTEIEPITYEDASKEITYSINVLSASLPVWSASGTGVLNNALRFKLVSPVSTASAVVKLQIIITGRWR